MGSGKMLFYLTIIVLTLYILAIMPKMNKPNLDPFKDRYYAHRGLHDNDSSAPENSLRSFKMAVEKGYGIELDIRLTKDNIAVVFHDKTLKRACGLDKKVRDLNYDDLKDLNLFNSEEKIPLLEDVLNLVDGRVPLIVELKTYGKDLGICEIAAPILDSYQGLYCIESFDPFIVNWYRKNRPDIVRGQLSTNYFKDGIGDKAYLKFMLQNMLFNFYAKPDFIAFNHQYSNMLSYNIVRKVFKIPTFAYTIKTREDLERNFDHFDYFIFEGFTPDELMGKS